jgi:5-methylcytosine-specific restriction endonuclease McrA
VTALHAGGRQIARVRLQLAMLHGWVCARCGDPIDPRAPSSSPMGLSIGHRIPVSRGGTDAWSNLRPEHLRCNVEAGAEFLGMAAGTGKRPFPPNGARISLFAPGRK